MYNNTFFENTSSAFWGQRQRSIADRRNSALTHYAGPSCVITRQHETNQRIRYYRVLRKRSTDGRYQDERMNRVNERTNRRTNRQLVCERAGVSRAERGRNYEERDLERAWPRAITGPRQPRHYPQLSACVFKLGFRIPSGAGARARATARHRDPNVHTSLGDTEHGRRRRCGEKER